MVKAKAKKGKKRAFLRKLLLVLNALFIIFLLLAYLAPFINPSTTPLLSIIALAYPFLVIGNIIFLIIWLIQGRKRFILSLLAILLGYNHLQAILQIHMAAEKERHPEGLSVMSYNVRLFDYYQSNGKIAKRDQIFDFLREAKPDILCFQEYFQMDGDKFQVKRPLMDLAGPGFYHADYYSNLKKDKHFGLAIFTSLPILDSGAIRRPDEIANFAIYTDLIWQKDTIRVYNIHMESVRFSHEDYSFYHELTTKPSENRNIKSGSMKILTKLLKAYKKRGDQTDHLAEHISNSPYPVIICGDLNDTPISYTYRQISKGLKDAFKEAGAGFGETYSGLFPSFRIDYIFHSPLFQGSNYKTYKNKLSDHHPISLELRKEEDSTF